MAKRAKKPKTEITAIAQWGKDELLSPFCTLPVGLPVEDESGFDSPVVGSDEGEVDDLVESIESG